MRSRIDRWVYRTVAVCALLAGLAVHHNHTTQPCPDLGAAGMCVSISLES
ncbi:hypothetical protein [Micromonospora carbonacea]|uniref:Uncharacterized protein n=1 Tax=Micromonospora carbonacea TaxID=47853 RepID=A0A1C5A3P4_9ACTN|nr:hypothetical protein [Micromonospora carbonacea]SCF39654.1 hypothetical protein GA0070563_11148 [Micromonospora carbonacea]